MRARLPLLLMKMSMREGIAMTCSPAGRLSGRRIGTPSTVRAGFFESTRKASDTNRTLRSTSGTGRGKRRVAADVNHHAITEDTSLPLMVARGQLAYGIWLRRQRRVAE